jgi:hypothetical protein
MDILDRWAYLSRTPRGAGLQASSPDTAPEGKLLPAERVADVAMLFGRPDDVLEWVVSHRAMTARVCAELRAGRGRYHARQRP